MLGKGNAMVYKLSLYEKIHFLHRCFRYRFRTEKQQLSKMLSYDLNGKVVFDVGANHGIYSYWLAKSVGARGQIHAFEPQSELILEIEKISKWLNYKSIKLNAIALSDKSNKKTLKRLYVGDGSASLEDRFPSPEACENLEIHTVSMDEYCLQQGVNSMGYLKIDVEGHELSVIRGGIKTIDHFKPIIQVELRVHEASCDQVIDVLETLGYKGMMFCDGKEIPLERYKEVPSIKFGFSGHRDFIFEPV